MSRLGRALAQAGARQKNRPGASYPSIFRMLRDLHTPLALRFGGPGLQQQEHTRDGIQSPHDDPLRSGLYAARRRPDRCSRPVVRGQPKTDTCVGGTGSARVLIAWCGLCRLVAPDNKEQLKMKRIRIVGLCLMAVFALSAVVASSASAGELLFKASNGNIVGGSFKSLGGLSLLRTLGGSTIHCLHVDNHGKFLSTTLGDVLILFLGCTTVSFGSTVNCHNQGTNEIDLPLATTLFHLGLAHFGSNVSIPAIDILLGKTLEFKCSIATVSVKGDAIGALELTTGGQVPLNNPVSEMNLVYEESEPGMQKLTEFLMPGRQSGQTAFDHLPFSQKKNLPRNQRIH